MHELQNLISKVFKILNRIYVRFGIIYITYILLNPNALRIDNADMTNANVFLEKNNRHLTLPVELYPFKIHVEILTHSASEHDLI